MTAGAQIVVLAKSPRAGKVKTRLTPPYSPDEAAALARAALVDTLRAAAGADVRRVVAALDGAPGDWLPDGVVVQPQCDGLLDSRIAHAMVGAYADLPLPVLLVGMDTPQVTSADLDAAVALLLEPSTDAVLGPATDGGYWAIGLVRPLTQHVESVPMSRGDTGARQLERLQACGLRTRLLDTRRDVDLAADVDLVAAEAPAACSRPSWPCSRQVSRDRPPLLPCASRRRPPRGGLSGRQPQARPCRGLAGSAPCR